MADEPISALTQISPPPFSTSFTNPTTGAVLEILDTTNTSMASTGTNSKIAPGDLLKGYLAAGANVTLTETSGIVTIAETPVSASNAFASLSSNYALTTSYSNAGVSIILPHAGTYLLMSNVRSVFVATQNTTAGSNLFVSAQLYDSTNSMVVPGSVFQVFENAWPVVGVQLNLQAYGMIGPLIYTPTVTPATIQLQALYNDGAGGFTYVVKEIGSDANGVTSMFGMRIS